MANLGQWRAYLSRPIPCRPKPLDDELFSSWVLRLALHSGMKPQSFCQMMWPGKPFWNRSLDRSADSIVMTSLSTLTATPMDMLQNTLLTSFEGTLFPKLVRNGNTRWILPLAIYHRKHLRSGLSFCPRCLEEREPYFRRSWRLSLFTVCEQHRCVLYDECSFCRTPVQPHRIEMGNRMPYTNKGLYLCTSCGGDLRTIRAESAMPKQLSNQLRLRARLQPHDSEKASSLEHFAVLAQILRLLASRSKRISPLRKIVADGSASPDVLMWTDEVKWLTFDGMGVRDRRNFLGAACWMMEEWPERFLTVCRLANLRPSDLMRDFDPIPDWYRSAACSLAREPTKKAREERGNRVRPLRAEKCHA